MATKQSIAGFLIEQIINAGVEVYAKKMFGEYGIFLEGKMVALICDDQFFVKPTALGRKFIGDDNIAEASPYKGAKPYFLISGDKWDDAKWLAELIKLTAPELPLPTKKKK
mgnify:CR=1 FL=1